MTTYEFIAGAEPARRQAVRNPLGKLIFEFTAGQKRALGAVADGVTISVVIAALLAWGNTAGVAELTAPPWAAALIVGAWVCVLAQCGGYSLPHLDSGMAEYRRVILASGLVAGGLGVACFLLGAPLEREFYVLTIGLSVAGLLGLRILRRRLLYRLRGQGLFTLPVLLVGGSAHIDDVATVLRREKWLGYRIVGAVTDDVIEETASGLPVLGRIGSVLDLVKDNDYYSVIFTDGSFPDSSHFRRLAWELEALDTNMIVVPAITDVSAGRLTSRPVAGLPFVHVERPQAYRAAHSAKRVFDIAGSGLLLILAAPILAVAALLVWAEDREPVVFRQTRVGRGGADFECLKIRSMGIRAEEQKAVLADRDQGAGVLFKVVGDPRITRIGRHLRRFSIDELPQLWNVLRGDMSLVGPRPALPSEVAGYDHDEVRRLDVRPGLTGLWQVSGRSDLPWTETVRLDTYYVDNWSMVQDLTIMGRTAKAVLGGRGAY